MDKKTMGVIGSGLMGSSIAQAAAQAGFKGNWKDGRDDAGLPRANRELARGAP